MREWQRLRPGDWLTLVAGVASTAWLFATLWQTDRADRAIIRAGGKVIGEYPLNENRNLSVAGPLGTTRIAIQGRRARVEADPSPRQYCVKQGWLTRQGEMAACLPNQVSLELAGSKKLYDSLSY